MKEICPANYNPLRVLTVTGDKIRIPGYRNKRAELVAVSFCRGRRLAESGRETDSEECF